MKIILLTLCVLLPPSALAGEPEQGRCYERGEVFLHQVVAKLKAGQYEIASRIRSLGTGVLKSKRSLSPGLVAFPVKYVGTREAELLNGFTARVRVWEECK